MFLAACFIIASPSVCLLSQRNRLARQRKTHLFRMEGIRFLIYRSPVLKRQVELERGENFVRSFYYPERKREEKKRKKERGGKRCLIKASISHVLASQPAKKRRSLSCLLYTSPSPRDQRGSRMPSSA